jgi:threonylcarbamoyladenosine tRNA methylthiotransferase MtaB
VGCYAQLKPEELASVDGVDLVLGATENLNWQIISMICLKMILMHSCEIAEADFMWEVIR